MTAFAFREPVQTLGQQIVNGVRQVKVPVAHRKQGIKMAMGIRRLVMASLQNGEAPSTQAVCEDCHGTSMQQQALAVHLHRPLRIRAEIERVLNQSDGSSFAQRGVICKQLVGINKREIHPQASPARRQARRPMEVA